MDILQNLLDNTNLPFLSAFLLGLMTAISPCPLATNITATAFISRNIENKRQVFTNGLIYTAGRAFSYTLLGVILYFGASSFQISKLFQSNGEKYLGPLLLIIGILMLDIIPLKFPSLNNLSEKISNSGKKGSALTAFLLGVVFALAFCPYSGVLYFGMLIPMTISSASGLFLPIIFAVATGLPVLVIAYLLAFSVSGIGNFYRKMKTFETWFRKIVAFIFIAVGFYQSYIFFISNWIKA